jgi:hypothetical protein
VNPPNVIDIPVFIDVHDVMDSMKCSRTTAYAHMRAALRRMPGERGQLRVPVYVWHRYVRARFDRADQPEAVPRRARPSGQHVTIPTAIPITRPRTKPRTDSPSPADRR